MQDHLQCKLGSFLLVKPEQPLPGVPAPPLEQHVKPSWASAPCASLRSCAFPSWHQHSTQHLCCALLSELGAVHRKLQFSTNFAYNK